MTRTAKDVAAAIKAQSELCALKKLPHFAPCDGVCWACHLQIYEEEHCDGNSFVTGCPWCHRSYCD